MSEDTLKQINKFNKKIMKTLTKLSQDNPQISESIELALFSAIKIQKIITKSLQTHEVLPKAKTYSNSALDFNQFQQKQQQEDDQLFKSALKMMDGFKSATHKLQRKFNIFLNQTQIKKKSKPYSFRKQQKNDQNLKRQIKRDDFRKNKQAQKNLRPRTQNNVLIKKANSYQPNIAKIKDLKSIKTNYKPSQIAQDFDQTDSNMSQLDYQIMKLTDRIGDVLLNQDYQKNQNGSNNEDD